MKVIELDFSNTNVTIVGLGLIGGSYAMALRSLSPKNLLGVDIDTKTVKAAEESGVVDKAYLQPELPLKEADLVIISLYPKDTIKFIRDNLNNFKSGAIITDVSGIKERVVREVETFIPSNLDFIGGHPMAGRESRGLSFARGDIFKDANYIITPTEKNKAENIAIIKEIATAIGCRNIIEIEPEEHDKIIAYTSGVPHLIAVALMNSESFDSERSLFIGGSFRDATRVALINSDLWSELFTSNKGNIISELEEFERNLSKIKKAIKDEDVDAMKNIFDNAGKKRRDLNG